MDGGIKLQDNADIQKALKDLDVKSEGGHTAQPASAAPAHEVEGIKFETDSYKAVKFYNETTTPKIVKLVMKCSGGLIKEESHASYVLLFLAIVMIGVSVFLFFGSSNKFRIRPEPPANLPPSTYLPPGLKFR